jgi:hypothetical protein
MVGTKPIRWPDFLQTAIWLLRAAIVRTMSN